MKKYDSQDISYLSEETQSDLSDVFIWKKTRQNWNHNMAWSTKSQRLWFNEINTCALCFRVKRDTVFTWATHLPVFEASQSISVCSKCCSTQTPSQVWVDLTCVWNHLSILVMKSTYQKRSQAPCGFKNETFENIMFLIYNFFILHFYILHFLVRSSNNNNSYYFYTFFIKL